MKLRFLLTLNAILFLGFGIGFALYGPLMIDLFGILDTDASSVSYWYVASFARLAGAAFFGLGLLIFAIRNITSGDSINPDTRRGIIAALLIANVLGLIVSLTQQVSIWGAPFGWVIVGVYLLLTVSYGYFLVVR